MCVCVCVLYGSCESHKLFNWAKELYDALRTLRSLWQDIERDESARSLSLPLSLLYFCHFISCKRSAITLREITHLYTTKVAL